MNISKSLRLGVVASTAALLLSGLAMNASADENKGKDSNANQNSNAQKGDNREGIQNIGIRSHGHPIQNFVGTPSAGSQASQNAYVSNDDANAEGDWQAWNKQSQNNNVTGQARTGGGGAVTTVTNPISWHNGVPYGTNVMLYPVWAGTWNATRLAMWDGVLGNLVKSLGASTVPASGNIFSTNFGYFSGAGYRTMPKLSWTTKNSAVPVVGTVSSGLTQVSDANVTTAINAAITAGYVPSASAAATAGYQPIYIYIGSSSTRLSSGFGTQYCGWHSYGTMTSSTTKVPFIAIQDFTSTYLTACTSSLIYSLSPNSDPYVDATASILVHEIDESLSDPDVKTGWFDGRGAENADKCAWTFGTTATAPNGAKSNYVANGKSYLIQRNWLASNVLKEVVGSTGNACSITN